MLPLAVVCGLGLVLEGCGLGFGLLYQVLGLGPILFGLGLGATALVHITAIYGIWNGEPSRQKINYVS